MAKTLARKGKKKAMKPAHKAAKKPAPKKLAKAPKKITARRHASAPKGRAKASGIDAGAVRDRAVAHVRYSNDTVRSFIKGLDRAQATTQAPGNPNHVIWTLGHLTTTYHWIANCLDGQGGRPPENYDKIFGMGSKPTNNPADYPSLEEVTQAFNDAQERLVQAAESLTGDTIFAPAAQDTQGWITDRHDALLKAAWHTGWHTGQLASLRRSLGLPAVYGG
jgi:uncharacterized damage-inducible protein DinB